MAAALEVNHVIVGVATQAGLGPKPHAAWGLRLGGGVRCRYGRHPSRNVARDLLGNRARRQAPCSEEHQYGSSVHDGHRAETAPTAAYRGNGWRVGRLGRDIGAPARRGPESMRRSDREHQACQRGLEASQRGGAWHSMQERSLASALSNRGRARPARRRLLAHGLRGPRSWSRRRAGGEQPDFQSAIVPRRTPASSTKKPSGSSAVASITSLMSR